MICAGLEERGGVSGKLLAEKEWVFAEDELFELGPPLQQWPVSQILTLQVQKVEGAEDQLCGRHRIADFRASKSEMPFLF